MISMHVEKQCSSPLKILANSLIFNEYITHFSFCFFFLFIYLYTYFAVPVCSFKSERTRTDKMQGGASYGYVPLTFLWSIIKRTVHWTLLSLSSSHCASITQILFKRMKRKLSIHQFGVILPFFTKGNSCRDSLFVVLEIKALSKMISSERKEFAPRGANSFL